jgi:hypothetical protein
MTGGLHMIADLLKAWHPRARQIMAALCKKKDRLFWFDRSVPQYRDGCRSPDDAPYQNSCSRSKGAGTNAKRYYQAGHVWHVVAAMENLAYGDELQISFSLKRSKHTTQLLCNELAAGQGGAFSNSNDSR